MFLILLSVMYYIFYCWGLSLIFRHTLSMATNLLAIILYVIGIPLCVGIAEFTIKKIRDE